jgi:short-subunit dehydrogenase
MTRPLSKQTVVITGASSGIGRETAILMGKQGANLVLAARDEGALNDVAREVERVGGRSLAVVTDVAEWPQVERLAKVAFDHYGRIDTWVNDAGIGLGGRIEDTDVSEMERLIRVNLMGQIHGVKAALPYMKQQKAGAFINIGSVAGVRTFPLQTTYCASKHAVKSFTEGLRLELDREPGEYHVTYIAPAAINTPFFPTARSKFGTEINPPPAGIRPAARGAIDRFRRRTPPARHLRGGRSETV